MFNFKKDNTVEKIHMRVYNVEEVLILTILFRKNLYWGETMYTSNVKKLSTHIVIMKYMNSH